MGIRRNTHWTDTRKQGEVSDKIRTRTIAKWANYQVKGSEDFLPAASDVDQAQGVPNDWEGNFDFRFASSGGPVQFFLGDTSDPDHFAPLWGFRLSRNPRRWVNFLALAKDATPQVSTVGKRRFRWQGLWNNCALIIDRSRHRLDTKIRINGAPHRKRFTFAVKMGAGMTMQVANNRARFFDPKGRELFKVRPPVAYDSSTVANDDLALKDGTQNVPVQMIEGPTTARGLQTLQYVIDPDDLAGKVYPIFIE